MYEELVVTGAWWDYVDVIASRRLGRCASDIRPACGERGELESLGEYLEKTKRYPLPALFKADTDLQLLDRLIEPSLSSNEFFLRKAIGWALRQYAWTNPREVCRYVKAHRRALSPLTKREALKNVLASGLITRLP